MNEEQVALLERFSPEFRERHIETRGVGDLVAVDTFFVGTLKGVGKVYLQSVIDCHSRYAWGRLYTSKLPVKAVHVLNTDVLPFFEEHEAVINTILIYNGREFCAGRTAIPMNSSCNWRASIIAKPRCAALSPTALWSGFTARFWTSTSVSWGAKNGMNRWKKCKRTWRST